MLPQNSSTSSSEVRFRRPSLTLVLTCTVLNLAAFDIGLGIAFPYPADPDRQPPNAIQTLLEYGRSTSGKLRRMTAMETPPWWINGRWVGSPNLDRSGGTGHPRVAFFGNSFLARTAVEFRQLAPRLPVTECIGTFSPPSQALGCYRQVRAQLDADVVVMGMLASTWPLAHSFANASFSFTNPEAYTYPIYTVQEDGSLHEEMPLVATRADLKRRFEDPAFDAAWLAQLEQFDERYDPLLYDETLLDRSALVRLARRGYANWARRKVTLSYGGPRTFDVKLWSAIAAEFAREVRADGRQPIVVLFHDFGYGDDLYQVMRPALEQGHIPFVSSHTLFPADDPASYVPGDLHYTPANDRRIAQSLLAQIGHLGTKVAVLPAPPGERKHALE